MYWYDTKAYRIRRKDWAKGLYTTDMQFIYGADDMYVREITKEDEDADDWENVE